jgi:hypothetical protein
MEWKVLLKQRQMIGLRQTKISMIWKGVESFAETKANNWSETNQNIVPHTWCWANIFQMHMAIKIRHDPQNG